LRVVLKACKTLDELWEYVERLHSEHFPRYSLAPIFGGGRITQPKLMCVFINPTAKNISSRMEWRGPRFPFIGTRQVWRVFHRAGFFDSELLNEIEASKYWSLELTNRVLNHLAQRGLYLTNLVKHTGHDATLPNSRHIKLFLPILIREIEIVKPEYIVSFGLLPFTTLTGERIKLNEYYSEIMATKRLRFYTLKHARIYSKVIPCYFPVGRGKPNRAIAILKLIAALGI